jgi:hypothetical protein
VSAFLPRGPEGGLPEPEHPRLQERPLSTAERRARWEVRAAQWRAREIAESVFGDVTGGELLSVRSRGPLRGLLSLEVPFVDVRSHRDREARFLAAVAADPVLTRIRLVYVIGPQSD